MSGLTSDQLATIAFETGIDPNGLLNAVNGTSYDDETGTVTLSSAHKWNGGFAGSSGGNVAYYFDPGSYWSAAEKSTLTSALALWSAVANITFTQVTNFLAADVAFYRYGSATAALQGVTLHPRSTYVASSYVAGSPGERVVPATQSAYLSIDTSVYGWQNISSFTYAGGYAMGTVVHEFGHLLGLAHAGPYNGNVNPATQQYNATDTKLWSTMSYIDPTTTSAKYYADYPVTGTNWTLNGITYTPTTFMPLDILAAQRLYGTPASTPLNNVTFGFNCTIQGACEPFFDFTKNTTPVITLYATGLNNRFDVSGWSATATINLNPGTFSSVDGLVNNVGIAFGTRIDTAIGGAGNDTFIVNADADTIDGAGGTNAVIFSGSYASYATGRASDGSFLVSKAGVTDTLRNVQTVYFSDQTITIPTASPTVTSVGFAPTLGEAVTGNSVTLTLGLNAAVTVAGGVPVLTLNDGGTARYSGGSGGSTLSFAYTVASGERTADLAITGIVMNGATINDSIGDAANLSGAVGAAASHLRITGELQAVDFEGNGNGDVLFHDPVGGGLSDFLMTNNQPTWANIGWADPALAVVGAGDFLGNGTSDILFRDPTQGQLSQFVINNNRPSWANIGWADPALKVVGTGDFTGSGTDDILFRDPTSGNLGDFVMNGGQPTWASIGWASPALQVVGIGDFNGDGTTDILFRDPTGGGMSMFAMHNNQPSWSYIGWADPSLQVAGTGDFNGDGTDDILFRDPVGGGLGDFVMHNGQASWAAIGWAAPAMQVVGTGKYNGIGNADDIMFRDPVGGGLGDFVMTNNKPVWAAVGWASPGVYVSG